MRFGIWILPFLFLVAGCSAKVTSNATAHYAFYSYVLNTTAPATVMGFSVDPNSGNLVAIGQPINSPNPNNYGIVGDSKGRFLYVTSGDGVGSGQINVYAIDPKTGNLTSVGSPMVFGEGEPNVTVLHPNGQMLYVSGALTNQIFLFQVAPNGTLTANSAVTPNGITEAFGMALDSTGQNLYVADNAAANLGNIQVDPGTGNLLGSGGTSSVPPATLPNLTVDPLNRFLYAYSTTEIYAYALTTANGALPSTIPSSGPFAPGTSTVVTLLTMSLDGRFLFVAGSAPVATETFLVSGVDGSLVHQALLSTNSRIPYFDPVSKIALAPDAQGGGTVEVMKLGSDGSFSEPLPPTGTQGGTPLQVWIARPALGR